MHAVQSKNGIVMNPGVSVKNQMIGDLVNKVKRGILVNAIVSVIRHVEFVNI